jgi:hypothetical protein
MNNHYSEFLESVNLPAFILVKNLWFEHENDFDAPISRGEIIRQSKEFSELKKIIPQPDLPEDDYKQSLFEKKLGELKISNAVFDDSPYDIAEGDPTDYEIFGQSYTILWMCSPDIDELTDFLVERYNQNRDLIFIWENYIDRMHIFPFYSLEMTSDDFYEEICNAFEDKVNNLKNSPSQKEWDELNDYLF